MTSPAKAMQLALLAQKRKGSTRAGYKCIGDYHHGAYDSDHVSPYTKSAGNLDARLMFVLQDLSCHESLSDPVNRTVMQLGYNPKRRANQRLVELLHDVHGLELSDVYVTNLFPLVKLGGMSAAIPAEDLVWAATEFTWPEVRIVRPEVVVALGLGVFNALRAALDEPLPRCKNLDGAMTRGFIFDGINVRCLPHPAARIGRERMLGAWRASARAAA